MSQPFLVLVQDPWKQGKKNCFMQYGWDESKKKISRNANVTMMYLIQFWKIQLLCTLGMDPEMIANNLDKQPNFNSINMYKYKSF